MKPVSWMNVEQASVHMGFRTIAGFESWVRRELADSKTPLRVYWLRGRRRFRQVDLDACVELDPRFQ